ncbi:MAG: MATE family efflux transporter [Eubacteriales bacterium]|nr:MATE family efflux transporter [Eubacteriales bacterium]
MTKASKTELFETMPIPKAVAKLSVPTVLSTLIMVLYNLADTYFVGALNDPVESAAVTLAAPVLLAFNAVINLFGVGCSSYMSRALGIKDYETVKRTSVYGFYCALCFSLLYSLGCAVFQSPLLRLLGAAEETVSATSRYMFWTVVLGAAPSILNLVLANLIRSEGESLHASIGTISGCLLNVVLDPVFIMPWGLGMGASGAGCATFISNCVACAYFLIFLFVRRGKTFVSIDPRKFRFDKKIISSVAAVGVPAAVQNLLNVTGMTVLNNFTSAYGTDAVAAMGITHKINMVPMYISMGLGQGIMPLVGYNYSSGNSERMKKAITFTAKLSVGFIVIATALYYFFAGPMISLFMKTESIVSYGTDFLRGFCLGLPFLCVDFLAVGIFQAVGMGKESFLFAVLRKVALEIPALYILNKIWPLYGLSYSQLCAELVLAVAAVFVLKKLFRRADERAAEMASKAAEAEAEGSRSEIP